jgi:rRNA-processing protein FCF1
MKEAKKIFVDTNVWMAISGMKLDIFSELEKGVDFPFKIVVLSGVVKELEKIENEQRGKEKKGAKLALQIIKNKISQKEIKVSESLRLKVDDELTELSKNGELVLTQDVLLKKRLSKPYLTIRQKKKVMMIK